MAPPRLASIVFARAALALAPAALASAASVLASPAVAWEEPAAALEAPGLQPPPAIPAEDEARPWSRSDGWFVKAWLVAGPFAEPLEQDPLAGQGGEASLKGVANAELKRADGTVLRWKESTSWSDAFGVDEALGLAAPESGTAYAYTLVKRAEAGPALLSIGSDDGVRVWVNGRLVHEHRGRRPLVFDEDRVPVELGAGENAVLVRTEQRRGPWAFSLRVLEPGTVLVPVVEIGPAVLDEESGEAALAVRTDVAAPAPGGADVAVEVIAPGGGVVASGTAPRGRTLRLEVGSLAAGPYEVRFNTMTAGGKAWTTHLPWWKGDPHPAAQRVVEAGKSQDATTPAGRTRRMLADLVLDRAGGDLAKASPEALRRTHAAVFEAAELDLEAGGKTGRVHGHGFYRLAWVDDVDGSVQFCRAYLPAGYRPDRRWPLVVQLHGYNPANPEYVRWWAVDSRHHAIHSLDRGADGPVYIEPHGRGNTAYRGFGEKDVLRAIAEAKKALAIDEDRVYLMGDSMGGWGTWQVATRSPEVFAAIAPIYGGADYRAQLDKAVLAKLLPAERFLHERRSSWAQAEGLLNLPILVSHGDQDKAVNVEYSRWAVRMLQRWGYDVRYHELPGRGHEDMKVQPRIWEWLLQHRRRAHPRQVRVRAADLPSARAYWVRLTRAERPMEFLVAEAEVIGPNRLRLDTRNVAVADLAPGPLVDATKPVEVVWNGVARTVFAREGRLELVAEGRKASALEKTDRLAGPFEDAASTPFAVVLGTISPDPAMRRACEWKVRAFVAFWRDWQKVEPRVFRDAELSDADASRYSLLLVGGPGENAVTKRLSGRLPLALREDAVVVDGTAFPARDAGVSLVYPSPLHPERYVAVLAGTSPGGLWFADWQSGEWDFQIVDGRSAPAAVLDAPGEFPERGRIASGTFDSSWRYDEGLVQRGDEALRAKATPILPPRPVDLPTPALDRVTGTYEIPGGPRLRVVREGERLLVAQEGQGRGELVPESETDFFLMGRSLRLAFEAGPGGTVVALVIRVPGREIRAKRVDAVDSPREREVDP
ncbi:MAG TPA: prolyl oligopeptidase family serine peptidase [Vicinamibacteria bacterium]